MTKQMELTIRVAELLGWTHIKEYENSRLIGCPPGREIAERNMCYFTPPSFATDIVACINGICQDERLEFWHITQDVVCLQRGLMHMHDGTDADISRVICEAFVQLCDDEG